VPHEIEQATMVNRFLKHIDRTSKEKFVYANIYTEEDSTYRVEVQCDCGCGHRFVRKVENIQRAWFTVHILNEVTFTVMFLAKFIKKVVSE